MGNINCWEFIFMVKLKRIYVKDNINKLGEFLCNINLIEESNGFLSKCVACIMIMKAK